MIGLNTTKVHDTLVQKSLIKFITLYNKCMPIKFILKIFTSFHLECLVLQLPHKATPVFINTHRPTYSQLVLLGQSSEYSYGPKTISYNMNLMLNYFYLRFQHLNIKITLLFSFFKVTDNVSIFLKYFTSKNPHGLTTYTLTVGRFL